jgi:intracellular multiplication protein IcmK
LARTITSVFFASALAVLAAEAMIVGFSSPALAEDGPPSLISPASAAASGAVAGGAGAPTSLIPDSGAAAAKGAAMPTAIASDAALPSSNDQKAVAQDTIAKIQAAAAAAAAKDTSNGKTSPGIAVTGSPPSLAVDASMLERQAEETAARAAAEEAKREQEHNVKSFKKASDGLLPMSPEQIRAFMRRLENTQEAAQPPNAGPPKGIVKVASISLDPGGEPPTVNLAAGFITTIDLIDASGQPWPILDVGVGGNFEVTPTQAGSHVVRIVPLTRYGQGNLSILLKGLSTPIIFRLNAGGPTFHMRYDARVPKMGPDARTPIIDRPRGTTLVAGDQVITSILENAPPKEAKRMKIGGLDARTMAWRVNDKVYVRTPLTMLSPAWNASAASPDGMTVYEIGDAPVLLMSDNGSLVRARLVRDEDHDK